MRSVDLVDPKSGGLSQLFRKVRNLVVRSTSNPEVMLEDYVILTALLKEKATEVIKHLSESHWTSSCIITMTEFQNICGTPNEASAILSYLSELGKARFLSVNKKELIEGVKVSLSQEPASTISSLDFDVLHLVWTIEKLQKQVDVIDQRYEISRKLALASLKSGNKKIALRHAREMKVASENREKCTSLLNRVEEVHNIIMNAESTKKVTEAIQIGAQAMKKNKITVEEVDICLEEIAESIDSQNQVEKALESTTSYAGIDDDEIEEELKNLELEIESKNIQSPTTGMGVCSTSDNLRAADSLTEALSNLRLQDAASTQKSVNQRTHETRNATLEAA